MSKVTGNECRSPAELSVFMEEIRMDEDLRYLETGVYILYFLKNKKEQKRRGF